MGDDEYYDDDLDYDDEHERESALNVSYVLKKKHPQPIRIERMDSEFSLSQLGAKNEKQRWLILTSRMCQKTVNYAIACARARLPIDARLEHLRCLLVKMLPQPEEKSKPSEKNAIYVVGQEAYEAQMIDDGLWFSGLIHVTTSYEVVMRELTVDTTCTLASDISACPNREVMSTVGFFGDIKLRDLSKSRDVIESGLSVREKEIVSCWFDKHKLTSQGFSTDVYAVTDKEYLDVMTKHFGMKTAATPWYVNVPRFITDEIKITTDCGCGCHVGRQEYHVDGRCDWCLDGTVRVVSTMISESHDEHDEQTPVTVFEHLSDHSTLQYEVKIRDNYVTKVDALMKLEIIPSEGNLRILVKDRTDQLVHMQDEKMSSLMFPVQVEVFNEKTMPGIPCQQEVKWLDYILVVGHKVRAPLPFRPPYITEAMEFEGYDSNCFLLVVGKKIIALSKTWEEEVPLATASEKLTSMAMNSAVGILMRDASAIASLIGDQLFDHLLMSSKWCVAGFYFADLIFNGLSKVSRLSPQWGITYRNAMIPIVSRFSVPQWLIHILMATELPNEVIVVLIRCIEGFPVYECQLHDDFDVSPLDVSMCSKLTHLTRCLKRDVKEFRYRGVRKQMTTKKYDETLRALFSPYGKNEGADQEYDKRMKAGTFENEIIHLHRNGFRIRMSEENVAGVELNDVNKDQLYMEVGD